MLIVFYFFTLFLDFLSKHYKTNILKLNIIYNKNYKNTNITLKN